ncbi:MAG: DUF2955 domain-containing protein [Deltaproteobacteria bacterium]|nr:DUF2955 domain-containing protein [Deltaproteobacteria bacterium]
MPTDADATRALRLTLGTAGSAALALGIGGPLAFIAPLLTAKLLSSPAPRPTPAAGLMLVLSIAVAFGAGWVVSLALLPFPLVRVPLLGLMLFWTFYASERGAPPLLIVMLLLALVMLPVVSVQSQQLSMTIAAGMSIGAALAMAATWLAFALLPDRPEVETPGPSAATPDPLERAEVVQRAVVATVIVLPMLALVDLFQLTGDLVVLAFVALLAQQLGQLGDAVGRGGGALLVGNAIGGVGALVAFQVLTVVPMFPLLIGLTALTTLLCARRIFPPTAASPLYATALSTWILLVASSTGGMGGEAAASFYARLFNIALAVVYVVVASSLLRTRAGRRLSARALPG